MEKYLLACFWRQAIFCLILFASFASPKLSKRTLIISFDGFRWDYLKRFGLSRFPNFLLLIKSGVHAAWMDNAFTTETFPNHFTLSTGLYEESHGVVANVMHDPVLNATYWIGKGSASMDTLWFHTLEPVWITNEIQGGISAVSMWAGNLASYGGHRATYIRGYDHPMPPHERVVEMIRWLSDRRKPANLGMLYFEEPDHSGHKYGPNSSQVRQVIEKLDSLLQYILSCLRNASLADTTDLIIVSDHGMTEMSQQRVIYLQELLPNTTAYEAFGYEAVLHILPSPGMEKLIYEQLKDKPHFTTYRKADIPDRFHYRNNRRIMPIVLVADIGWYIAPNRHGNIPKGGHGYDNLKLDMQPIFIASGPSFKRNYKSEPFSNVNIYPLLCHLLGVTPAPNNGSLANVSHLLRQKEATQGFGTSLELGIVTGSLLVVGTILGLLFAVSVTLIVLRRRSKRLQAVAVDATSMDQNREPLLGSVSIEADDLDDTVDMQPLDGRLARAQLQLDGTSAL